jgi:hypothetical protein
MAHDSDATRALSPKRPQNQSVETLAAHLTRLAAELGEVQQTTANGGIEYLRAGRLFAVARGERVEIRLRPDIADAARRTPDTAVSLRGDEWVDFAPESWDEGAIDRLDAWVRVAWRAAGG